MVFVVPADEGVTLSSSQRTFPYISVMLGNGTLSYDHDRDGRSTELGGCTVMARNSVYDNFFLVRYSKNRLTVWPIICRTCFRVSLVFKGDILV